MYKFEILNRLSAMYGEVTAKIIQCDDEGTRAELNKNLTALRESINFIKMNM